jgi:FkbM family methyltransferase
MILMREWPDIGDSMEVLLSAIYHRIVRPGDVVIDGGANGGLHTIPLARLVSSDGRVIAYEPQPDMIECLRKYIDFEQLQNVVCLRRAAIGSQKKTASFNKNKSNTALSSLAVMNLDQDDWSSFDVEVVRIDDELLTGRCTFIKLDLEGGEYDALVGARSLIKRDRPIIAMEHGFHWAAERFGYDAHQFTQYFQEIGYLLFDFANNHVTMENYSDELLIWQLIAVPEESTHLATINETIDQFMANYDRIPAARDWSEVMWRVRDPLSLGYWFQPRPWIKPVAELCGTLGRSVGSLGLVRLGERLWRL